MLQVGMNVHVVDGLAVGLNGVITKYWGGTKVSVECEDGNVYFLKMHQLKEVK